MSRDYDHAVGVLLTDWLAAEVALVCERSGNIDDDVTRLYHRGKLRAQVLGVEWCDEFFDEYWLERVAPSPNS